MSSFEQMAQAVPEVSRPKKRKMEAGGISWYSATAADQQTEGTASSSNQLPVLPTGSSSSSSTTAVAALPAAAAVGPVLPAWGNDPPAWEDWGVAPGPAWRALYGAADWVAADWGAADWGAADWRAAAQDPEDRDWEDEENPAMMDWEAAHPQPDEDYDDYLDGWKYCASYRGHAEHWWTVRGRFWSAETGFCSWLNF